MAPLKGKASLTEGLPLHKVTLHNKPHTRYLLGGKTQEGGCLCLDEKQQRTEQEVGFLEDCGGV